MSLKSTIVSLIKSTVGEPKIGAEIGVYKANTSRALLDAFPDLYLSLVDPWREWEEGSSYRNHRRTGKLTQEKWDEVYNTAMQNVSGESRVSVYRMTSETAAKEFEDNSLCFSFLDGNHMRESVKQDIDMWVPKIRKGGIIIFHDFGGKYRGVKKAVLEVFEEDDLILKSDRICGVVIK